MSKSNEKRISVLAIDDHIMIINGIKLLLESRAGNFWHAHEGKTALELALEHKPELVVIDYSFPDTTGDTIVKEIRYHLPETRIIAYTFSFEEEAIVKMFYAGVNAYVLKSDDQNEFLDAVDTVMEGKEYFCQEARNHIVNRVSMKDDNVKIKIADFEFSQNDIEIVRLLCKEKTAKEISKEIFLSERTVELYRNSITKRIGAKNVVGVIKFAIKNGIVKMSEL